MEEAAFLMAVQRVVGGIQIEHDLLRRLGVRVEEEVDEQVFDGSGIGGEPCVARRPADMPPDNNRSEREWRPTATYRKVTGGFQSEWGADFFATVRSVAGIATRSGIGAYQAIRNVLDGRSVLDPG